ncbi:MAG: lytic transglycosylase domain-containing protein [Armatimonadota bacterium]
MRISFMLSVAVLGIGLVGQFASAASLTDYQAKRAQTEPVSLNTAQPLVEQFPSHAGKIVELEGTVSGIFGHDDSPGFVLQVTPGQMVVITAKKNDPDVAPNRKVRVLARIPENGPILEARSVTPLAAPAHAVVTPDTATPAASGAAPESSPAVSPTKPAPAKVDPNKDAVKRYAAMIRKYNSKVNATVATRIAAGVLAKSKKYGVDPRLVFALIAQESRFNHRAVSSAGARGLGQLMPGTAAMLGVRDSFNIEQNIDGSVRYLASMLKRFGGDRTRALAAYNAGPGNVVRYGGVPPFRETQNYVRVINKNYKSSSIQSL